MSKLITQSLIGAVDWFHKAPIKGGWKDKAWKDLQNLLGRVWTGSSPEAQKGIDLETKLNNLISQKVPTDEKWSKEFQFLYNKLKDCKSMQKKSKSFMKIEDVEYCLYGKIDYDFIPELIVDLKSTGEYKGENHYLGTFQHLIYCHNEKVKNFEYVIAEWENKESNKIKSLYSVKYQVDSFEKVEQTIRNKIVELISFLKSEPELFDLFNNKYSMF